MKEKLIIKNFGPIKDVEIELGKFNVLIGEQATGKSTIAKLLAVCRYFSYILDFVYFEKDGSSFSWGLITWGLDEAVKHNTYLYYSCKHYFLEGKAVNIPNDPWVPEEINRTTFDIKINVSPVSEEFKNLLKMVRDISSDKDRFSFSEIPVTFFQNYVAAVMDNPFYLPAERGLQSIFSLGKSSIQNISDALFNQLAALDRIARLFKTETPIEPLSIIYKNEDGKSYVRKQNEEIFLSLFHAATGYQSTIPVILTTKYYSEIRKKNKTFIIEEPELNLFPTAQQKLMQYLVEKCVNYSSPILLTTHSSYLLTSLNNMMYAHKLGQLDSKETEKIIKKKYWINQDDVSAYMMLPDGTCENILDKKEGLIKAEKIDAVSGILNEEFDRLLNIEFAKNELNT